MAEKDGTTTGPQEPSDSVVLHWLGDESVFTNGIPNRDVTAADGLSKAQLAEAIAHGTHTKAAK